jgi:hypothetical protein
LIRGYAAPRCLRFQPLAFTLSLLAVGNLLLVPACKADE